VVAVVAVVAVGPGQIVGRVAVPVPIPRYWQNKDTGRVPCSGSDFAVETGRECPLDYWTHI